MAFRLRDEERNQNETGKSCFVRFISFFFTPNPSRLTFFGPYMTSSPIVFKSTRERLVDGRCSRGSGFSARWSFGMRLFISFAVADSQRQSLLCVI